MRVQDNVRSYKAKIKITFDSSKDNIQIHGKHSVITHPSSSLAVLAIASAFTGMQTEKEAGN